MKPDVLSDEELMTAPIELSPELAGLEWNVIVARGIAQAQRDDTWQKAKEYYEPLLEQAQEEIDYISIQQLAIEQKLDDVELAIQQAREAGIKEVVDWIREHKHYQGNPLFTVEGQAQLKEWGIKEGQ